MWQFWLRKTGRLTIYYRLQRGVNEALSPYITRKYTRRDMAAAKRENLGREWLLLALATLAALPAPVLRLADITNLWNWHVPHLVEAAIFGVAIFAAATLLTWASEVAETEISAGLALVVLALIAVLPEYAVDLYFAITAHSNPDHAHLAIANMTGGNRLLVGMAWPVIFFIFWRRFKLKVLPIERGNALGILFLGAATIYSFSIPLRGNLSLIDTAIMFTLFSAYMYITSRSPPHEDKVFVGPAKAIGSLDRTGRRSLVLAIFIFAAAVIFAAAEPFATSLKESGSSVGVSEFVLVQWVAPLASESPEFILAGMLAMRGRHDGAMTILISSKVNQWTLLIGSLPLGYSIAGGTFDALSFDSRQSEEVFLTGAQSLFAVAILVSLSMSRWEAGVLFALFATQLFFTDPSIRIAYGCLYVSLAALILVMDVPRYGSFFRAARETWKGAGHTETVRATGPP
jgi:cation:H+ antiporter